MSTRLLLLLLVIVSTMEKKDEDVYTGPSEEDVVVLDKDTLEATIYSSEDAWLLELYAPWCGHCKTLRPEWAKLATLLKGEIKVAKIDASVNRQFDKTYDLKGYPHVVMIPAGSTPLTQDQKTKKSSINTKAPGLPVRLPNGHRRKCAWTKVSWWKD